MTMTVVLSSAVPLHAALYLRVSAARQAERELIAKKAREAVVTARRAKGFTLLAPIRDRHVMMRQIMALLDEYQSKENARHVLRALKENARHGFWNGSLPPNG